MKTFRQWEQSYTGTPFGTIHPIADLNAATGDAKISKSDLDNVEKYADRLYKSVGIDVEFTRHFLDRVNDARNKKQITVAELIRMFKQSYKRYGKKIAALGPDAEAVLNDMQTDVNMPFVLKWDGKELDLVAKTVMRKPNFATSNQKLSFEAFEFFPEKLHERITLPEPPTDLQKEADKIKQIIANRTPEDEESIRNHDENSFYAIEKYCEENGLKFHNGEMKEIVMQARPTIKYFKEKFNLDRPHEVDSSIKPMSSTTNKTRAYPSGHATQSMLVGLYVSAKFPEHTDGIIKAAKECGLGRVKAGFHYLADYVAGNLLAEKMFLVMNKDNYGKYIKE
jgi:hypothetical protein